MGFNESWTSFQGQGQSQLGNAAYQSMDPAKIKILVQDFNTLLRYAKKYPISHVYNVLIQKA